MNPLIPFLSSNSKIFLSSRAKCKISKLDGRIKWRTGILEYTGVTLLHEKEFFSFVEFPLQERISDFCGVTLLHQREFLSFME